MMTNQWCWGMAKHRLRADTLIVFYVGSRQPVALFRPVREGWLQGASIEKSPSMLRMTWNAVKQGNLLLKNRYTLTVSCQCLSLLPDRFRKIVSVYEGCCCFVTTFFDLFAHSGALALCVQCKQSEKNTGWQGIFVLSWLTNRSILSTDPCDNKVIGLPLNSR